MTEVEESGHHDLCFLGEPCSEQVAEHGFCSRQSTICIYCERNRICERLKQAENYARIAVMHTVDVDSYEQGQRDAIAAAVQRVEAIADDRESGVDWNWDYEADPTGMTRNPRVWIHEAVAAIKGDQR